MESQFCFRPFLKEYDDIARPFYYAIADIEVDPWTSKEVIVVETLRTVPGGLPSFSGISSPGDVVTYNPQWIA
ncbi:hypothetical protein Acr_00g0064330 [Actinidia rufa]|uniref:Uncharacterized protein n=1 Tax=Actinidia rufa TaxID=165716 RepID=A0A7J0DRH6_9ERIC|nr:hypothetical protein Acr_00g0064330 [Actinidia rufa]